MRHKKRYALLACAITTWLSLPAFAAETTGGGSSDVTIKDVVVEADRAKEEAKYESQQTTIITAEDIEKKQAKSVEEIIFNETGVTRTVDAMGRVGVSIRGAEPRHTLILIDGQPVMGDVSKYSGQGDELQRLGTENVERIEIIKGAASAKYGSDAIGGVINVVTKRPQKEAGFQFNVEGRRAKGDSDLFPYQNVFLRADSGQVGKFRAAVYGSKRDIMPIYSQESHGGLNSGEIMRNSLRYYGDIKNIGFIGAYDIDDKNLIEFNIDKTSEDLERNVKHTDFEAEGAQHFTRTIDRNLYRLSYKGNNGGNSDWNVSINYSKMNEEDLTLTSQYGASQYEGQETLNYIDNLEHEQLDIRASVNTQLNDRHLLTYGFGYTKETGEGSRLKSAPNTNSIDINPNDYSKNLYVENPSSVHDYKIKYINGVPQYDVDYERYGFAVENNGFVTTENFLTKELYDQYFDSNGNINKNVSQSIKDDVIHPFAEKLRTDNKNVQWIDMMSDQMLIHAYYQHQEMDTTDGGKKTLTMNGFSYEQEYRQRMNKMTIGRAEIKRQHFFIQDAWQFNDTTLFTPSVRIDHSDLFGTNATFNLGLTHNLSGKENRRLKANIGTGYTEPGMGELYYNWEMYPGMPVGEGIGQMGYYWIGNPDLKPEKSLNFDIGFEGENGKTSSRLSIFHNRIKDYMTSYYTGHLMDFYPSLSDENKWIQPPDMIYSFRNIGKAEITGVEAELNHRFNNHWSAHLGYTYLHAINKSDPDMPRQLLNRPQHKVDIGVTYENKGWRASLWGNYYIHMLDGNSIAGDGNYWIDNGDGTGGPVYASKGGWTYEKKTFGLWNLLLQKELSANATVYVGIDNLFNHHDDDRALMERVYKVGANFKFGPDAHTMAKELDKAVGEAEVVPETKKIELNTDWFIQRPFDVDKKEGVEFIGDYKIRWNNHGGENRTSARVTKDGMIGNGEKNIRDAAGHSFEQQLRLGVNARIGNNTNIQILASASGMNDIDTEYDLSDSKGLNHQRLENLDATRHVKKWDFSIGRLTEPVGITGYWFGKEYDGIRAVWTNAKTQVRLGYGDFSSSTGITDSAYTHAIKQMIFRAPTKNEWIGIDDSLDNAEYPNYSDKVISNEYNSIYKQLEAASTLDEKNAILNDALQVIAQSSPETVKELLNNSINAGISNSFMWKVVEVTGTKDGTTVTKKFLLNVDGSKNSAKLQSLLDQEKLSRGEYALSQESLDALGGKRWNTTQSLWKTKNNKINSDSGYTVKGAFNKYFDEGSITVKSISNLNGQEIPDIIYGSYIGKQMFSSLSSSLGMAIALDEIDKSDFDAFSNQEEAKNHAIQSIWSSIGERHLVSSTYGDSQLNGAFFNQGVGSIFSNILSNLASNASSGVWKPEEGSSMPLETTLANADKIAVWGTVLVQDQIPSIERAAFAQVKHQFGDHFGVQAWYLRSLNDDTHSIAYANGDHNDVASFDELANVVGVGATYRLNDKIRFSYEWGQNRTDFGRFMNGHTIYRHESGTSDFDIAGRANGGTPRFWVARIDVGHADTDVPGSWNAFADYKYFEHGSFFGGNGTESLPDRYLDGIKSFTIGGGYVPAKDFLIEAFYTFGAKGIGKRDTLYGSENFELGDYTRLQVTYKF